MQISTDSPSTPPDSTLRRHLPLIVLLGCSAIALTALVPRVWLVLLTDGLYVLLVLLSALGWGSLPAQVLGPARNDLLRRVCVQIGLGLGILSLATLGTGIAGLLSSRIAWTLVGVGAALALASAYLRQPARVPDSAQPQATPPRPRRLSGLQTAALLTLVPPLVIAVVGACLPAGVLWADEAHGYDALEYHLQAPREYYDARKISFLPQNVYASFPQQQEMLYLLLMHLVGGPIAAAIPSQLMHLACGVLAVITLAAWSPPGWPALMVAIAVGSVPWFGYLSALAYNELGMLFFTALAGCFALDQLRSSAADWRGLLTAGLFAGLAGACKYTAAAMVVVALAVAFLVGTRGNPLRRARATSIFLLGAGISLSPWLARNAAFTGNPVFPFAYSWFGGKDWSSDQARQWNEGHEIKSTPTAQHPRASLFLSEFVASPMFGLSLIIAAAGRAFASQRVVIRSMLLWTALILAVWIAWTHMPGRFLIPVIVPLGLLAGGTCGLTPRPAWIAWAAAIVLAALASNITLIQKFRAERIGPALSDLVGESETWSELHPVNQATPPDAYVWMIGSANVFNINRRLNYAVVFNRDPWIAQAEAGAGPRDCLDWLRRRGVTHLVFSWPEIARLRKYYGFSPVVTPQWVEQLVAAGLTPVRQSDPDNAAIFDIYALSHQ